jgi:segregation and condensation protein B
MESMSHAAKKLMIVRNDDEPETTPEQTIETVETVEPVEAVEPIEAVEMEAADDDAAEESADESHEDSAEETVAVGAIEDTVDDADESGEPVARADELRLLEALLFAAGEPLDEATLSRQLPDGVEIKDALARLKAEYSTRGVNLVKIGRKWTFRTADDLSWLLTKNVTETRKLSRAAIETLAIVAYHQPVTRAEIEDIRGVATAAGTLDVLLKTGWIRPRGRRKAPGRPITYGTNEEFLSHFGLEEVADLPGLDELKGAGLLEGNMPTGFAVPMPSDDATLRDDEDPLEPGDLDLGLAPAPELDLTPPVAVAEAAVAEGSAEADEAGAVDAETAEAAPEQGEADGDKADEAEK